MILDQLTDPKAVLLALIEFDRIGRKKFLEKYEFGRASKYFIKHEGKIYDSKPIIGVAYGYQHPRSGALKYTEFDGGLEATVKKAENLGFKIISINDEQDYANRAKENKEQGIRYWAFIANPRFYRIQEAVFHLQTDLWTTKRSNPKAGDAALIWQAKNKEGKRGIVALARILTDPENRMDRGNQFWVQDSQGELIEKRVEVRYFIPDGLPLWLDESKGSEFLKELSVAKARGGTVFKVTESQWRKLITVIGSDIPGEEESEFQNLVRDWPTPGTGQGFKQSSEERKIIETYAMAKAIQFLEKEWEKVEDVSANCSYDLHCSRGKEELLVEVKGTTGRGEKIFLTKNEVKKAHKGKFALFVVSEISLTTNSEETKAIDGVFRFYNPFVLDKNRLIPISYSYWLSDSEGEIISGIE